MSKQLATVAAGLATTTGVGSQYISSAGEAVSSLNYSEGFSSEADSESFHQAFATATPSTFLTEGVETGTDFVAEELSGFEVSSSFTVVSEKTVTPEPEAKPEVASVETVKVEEVKVEAPKVEVAPVVVKETPKPAPAQAVKQTVAKPAAVKPAAKKVAPKVSTDPFKMLVKFRSNGWSNGSWFTSEPNWVFNWRYNKKYYKTRYLDVKRFVKNLKKTGDYMEVKCNQEGKNFKCWDSVEKRTFDVLAD